MEPQEHPLENASANAEHIRERLHENARLIERTERALQCIARTFDDTRPMMGADDTGIATWKQSLEPQLGAKVEAAFQRIVLDLIGAVEHMPASAAQSTPSAQGNEAGRRPGRYRQLI